MAMGMIISFFELSGRRLVLIESWFACGLDCYGRICCYCVFWFVCVRDIIEETFVIGSLMNMVEFWLDDVLLTYAILS